MSDEKKVEAAAESDTADDTNIEAVWNELRDEDAAQANGTAADDEAGKAGEGDDGTGQADSGTPAEGEAAAKPASEEKPDDLWKDADPKLREAFEAERSRAEKAENVAKSHSGRLSQAYTELTDLRAKIASERDAGGAAKEGEEATTREERMKQLREEYPDLAAPILDQLVNLEKKVSDLEGVQVAQANERVEASLDEQVTILAEKHPDWAAVVQTDAYTEWALTQPGYIQEAIKRNANAVVDGASCASILAKFKQDTAAPEDPERQRLEERRREQMDGSQSLGVRTPGATKQGADDVDSIWRDLEENDRRKAASARRR